MWGTIPFGCSLVTIVLAFVFRKREDEPEDGGTLETDEPASATFGLQTFAPKEPVAKGPSLLN
jgi:hypothetical protein